jgi:hypothetical protein
MDNLRHHRLLSLLVRRQLPPLSRLDHPQQLSKRHGQHGHRQVCRQRQEQLVRGLMRLQRGKWHLSPHRLGSDGKRYFRSWTSSSLSGSWTTLAATEANPFARANNVAFAGTAWTQSISHGEMVRIQTDQTMTISPCNLRFLYQGVDPSSSASYDSLPWRLGLITQTNSAC